MKPKQKLVFIEINPDEIKDVLEESQLNDLGFTCEKRLCEYEDYKQLYERLWVWKRINSDNTINIVITYDEGNGYCNIVYTDVPIKELLN